MKNLTHLFLAFLFINATNVLMAKEKAPLKNISAKDLDSRPTEIDSNGDGKADIQNIYAFNGKLEKAVYDNDYDGKPDEWLTIHPHQRERIIQHENGKEKILENMDESGNISNIEKFKEEIGSDKNSKWKLVERKTYQVLTQNFKIEEFNNGKVVNQRIEPAEVH